MAPSSAPEPATRSPDPWFAQRNLRRYRTDRTVLSSKEAGTLFRAQGAAPMT